MRALVAKVNARHQTLISEITVNDNQIKNGKLLHTLLQDVKEDLMRPHQIKPTKQQLRAWICATRAAHGLSLNHEVIASASNEWTWIER